MTSYLRDLTELTTVANNDYLLISDTSDPTNKDKRISQLNLVGANISGAGTIATGGFTLTVPATGTAAIKSGTPTAGRVASWLDANTVQDAGFLVADIARLSVPQTFTGQITAISTIHAQLGFNSYNQTLATDTVLDITFGGQGFIFVSCISSAATRYLFAAFRSVSTPYCTALSAGTDAVTSTAILTGTTGTAGKMTVSAASNSHVYVENRLGSSIVFTLTFMCNG